MQWKNQQGSSMPKNICLSMCICKTITIPFQIHVTKSYTSVSIFFFWGMMVLMGKKTKTKTTNLLENYEGKRKIRK